ncbi:MAG: hypothetical protein PHI37_03360 [Candidatus Gracilibacteria bacterium]|nr:hypothetical protein [Candidatus Gracilibacteria bacterium]
MEIFNNKGIIEITSNSKNKINFNTDTKHVNIDGLDVTYPGEFEKAGILLEVKEYANILFYSFTIDSKHLVIISNDNFELKEEILSFFGDVDVLVIVGSRESAKIFENIEARVVVPYGESKQTFLTTLGQHSEEVPSYKIKLELSDDTSEFINLAE